MNVSKPSARILNRSLELLLPTMPGAEVAKLEHLPALTRAVLEFLDHAHGEAVPRSATRHGDMYRCSCDIPESSASAVGWCVHCGGNISSGSAGTGAGNQPEAVPSGIETVEPAQPDETQPAPRVRNISDKFESRSASEPNICANCGRPRHDHYSGPFSAPGEVHCSKYGVPRRVDVELKKPESNPQPAKTAELTGSMWFYASAPDSEDWHGPHDTVEEAMTEARSAYAGERERFWVDEALPVDWKRVFSAFADADRILEDLADYIHDNEHVEEPEPTLKTSKPEAQLALETWFATHVHMAPYWQCVGKPTEYPVSVQAPFDVSADLSPDVHDAMNKMIEDLGPALAQLMPEHLPAHWEQLTRERDEAERKLAKKTAECADAWESGSMERDERRKSRAKIEQQLEEETRAHERDLDVLQEVRDKLTLEGQRGMNAEMALSEALGMTTLESDGSVANTGDWEAMLAKVRDYEGTLKLALEGNAAQAKALQEHRAQLASAEARVEGWHESRDRVAANLRTAISDCELAAKERDAARQKLGVAEHALSVWKEHAERLEKERCLTGTDAQISAWHEGLVAGQHTLGLNEDDEMPRNPYARETQATVTKREVAIESSPVPKHPDDTCLCGALRRSHHSEQPDAGWILHPFGLATQASICSGQVAADAIESSAMAAGVAAVGSVDPLPRDEPEICARCSHARARHTGNDDGSGSPWCRHEFGKPGECPCIAFTLGQRIEATP